MNMSIPPTTISVAGRMRAHIRGDDLRGAEVTGCDVLHRERGLLVVERGNAFVNQGLQALLDSGFSALTADRISHIAVSNSGTAITASTTTLPGTTVIRSLSNVSRSAQTVTGNAQFTDADAVNDIQMVALLTGSTAADLAAVVGGSGASPYNEAFRLNLTSVTSYDMTLGYSVTLTATS